MTPWVLRLLLANVVMFLFTASAPQLYRALALVPLAVPYRPWTLVTYMFLHAGVGHLLFNMIGLFFFGPRLEDKLGSRGFLVLYFLSGIGGAAFSFLFAPMSAVVGASGAVFGVLIAFAYFWPDENIYIWGVLPIPAKVLAVLLVAVSLYSGVAGSGAGVAHFAHLGGLAFGFFYVRRWSRKRRPRRVEKPNSYYKAPGVKEQETRERWMAIRRERLHELNRSEVEALQAKIDRFGVKSLTVAEREFLDRMEQATR